MERLRQVRIEVASAGTEPLSERDKLRFVHGVGLRTLQLLEEGGYKNVRDIAQEDTERLAIRARLGTKKARLVQDAAKNFLESELPTIAAARAALADRLDREAAEKKATSIETPASDAHSESDQEEGAASAET
jgi:nucleotidyltransferase/DNA polymerase involved in DNA repair